MVSNTKDMDKIPIIKFIVLIGFSSVHKSIFSMCDITHPISDVRMYASASIAIDISVIIIVLFVYN
jgi:hypothetical protein